MLNIPQHGWQLLIRVCKTIMLTVVSICRKTGSNVIVSYLSLLPKKIHGRSRLRCDKWKPILGFNRETLNTRFILQSICIRILSLLNLIYRNVNCTSISFGHCTINCEIRVRVKRREEKKKIKKQQFIISRSYDCCQHR